MLMPTMSCFDLDSIECSILHEHLCNSASTGNAGASSTTGILTPEMSLGSIMMCHKVFPCVVE